MAVKVKIDPIKEFDTLSESMLIDLSTSGIIAMRSRASLYRDINAGRLKVVKVGNSTRIRVGDLRKLIGAA